MSPTICIPWRTDNGWRAELFDWVLNTWLATGFDVRVGVDDEDGPINVARALNRARRGASGGSEVLVVAAADHIPDADAVRSATHAARKHGWAPLFTATAGINRGATERLIVNHSIHIDRHITGEVPFCTALLAVRADVWDEIGGWDERFYGWGCEDTAFRAVLETLYPNPPALPPRRTIALWHEAADRSRFDANAAILGEYLVCEGDPEAMRALIARRAT